MDVPEIRSSWDDLLEGVDSKEAWLERKAQLKIRFLELIRDQEKPARPPLDLQVHDSVVVDDLYTRKLISYQVDEGERAHAYLGIPFESGDQKLAAIVALHGTFEFGKDRAAGLVDNPDKAYLDHLCRRGYIVIAPDHFVAGDRVPEKGPYDTSAFHEKYPNWTSVGKFTFEHSIAIDVLVGLPQVDPERIGAMGHSLGGQGTMFLAAYDERVKAAVCNCAASFFRHNPDVLEWSRDRWYVYFKHLRPALLRGELPPIDFHEIMALAAPRAFLDVAGINDGHRGTQRQRVLMLMKVMEAYQWEDAEDQFGFYIHGRGHSVEHESRELIYGFLDSKLRPEMTLTKRVGE
jgi:pimeloyl-ACP methyl ester carboxylesterase